MTQMKADNRPATLLLYVLVSFLFIYLLFDYVKPSPQEPVSYLSYFIYFIGFVAMCIFYDFNYRIIKEKRCAITILEDTSKTLEDVKAKRLEYHLHQFKDLGTTDENLSINRMLGHIHTEAESKKFESGLVVMNAFKDEFASKTMRLFGFQKVALQLGILGTFIGLAMAFKDISGKNVDDKAIDHLLRSLQIPFSASIAGLQVAFILWLHIDFVHKQQDKLFKIFEKCIDEVINLARHAIYKDSITVELQHVSSRMDDLSGRIEKGNELLLSQNNQIAEGLDRLKSANADLDTFLKSLTEKQQGFLNSVRKLYESLSPELINDHFQKLQTHLEIQAKQSEENISRHKEEIFEAFNQMVAMQTQYLEQLSKTDMREPVKEVLISAATNVTRELKSDFEKLIPEVSALVNQMKVFNTHATSKLSRKPRFRKWLNIVLRKRSMEIEKS